MASISRLPSTLAILLCLQPLFNACLAQNGSTKIPNFGDSVPVLGLMEQTRTTFQDGFCIDMLSPKNRTVIVRQNTTPLDAQFITGSKGGAAEPFVAISTNSYIVTMNEPANDLIANIAIPYNPDDITAKGVQAANTYVAVLAADKRSWVVDESTRTIQRSENQTRCAKLTSVSGEYMLVGRQSTDMGSTFVTYGTGAENTVKLDGGVGLQEAEFMDGLRVSVQTNQTVNMTVELREGINPGTLNDNAMPLNTFMWVVKTSNPNQVVDATMFFPFNRNMLVQMRPYGASPTTMLQVGRRPLNATSGTFLSFNADKQIVRELPEDRIMVKGVTDLDGQYIMMVTPPNNM